VALLLQQPNRRGQLNLAALMVQLTWQLKRHLCWVVSLAGTQLRAVLLTQQLSSRLRLVGPAGRVAPWSYLTTTHPGAWRHPVTQRHSWRHPVLHLRRQHHRRTQRPLTHHLGTLLGWRQQPVMVVRAWHLLVQLQSSQTCWPLAQSSWPWLRPTEQPRCRWHPVTLCS
jgi:hypothetical protein